MTRKTITTYLEEYRIHKSLSLVQSGLYSITQISDMVGFSNASRFASAFRRQFGLNPAEYNSTKHEKIIKKMYHKKHSDIVFCDTYIDQISIYFLFQTSFLCSTLAPK